MISEGRRPDFSAALPAASQVLRDVLVRSVAHDAHDRYQSAGEFADALQECSNGFAQSDARDLLLSMGLLEPARMK